MARPAILCRLRPGTLLDANPGFVDTFNWMVDFIHHLRGDGDLDAAKAIRLDRTNDSFPVIRSTGAAGGGGGGGAVPIAGEDNDCFAIRYTNTGTEESPVYVPSTIINCYYSRGAVVHSLGASVSWQSAWNSGCLAIKVYPESASFVHYGSIADMTADTSDPSYVVIPLYHMASSSISIDFRKMPSAQMTEVL